MLKNKLLFVLLVCVNIGLYAQKTIVDRIVGQVGNAIVTQSELESQYLETKNSPDFSGEITRCEVLEELLFRKLLVNQAKRDSLEVTDAQVDQELDRRISYYVAQFGSEQRMVEFYGKSIIDFKADLRDNVRDLLLAQQMQMQITSDVAVTPKEVKAYYNSIPKDSIPFIEMEVEVAQIVKKPVATKEEKKAAKEKIMGIRNRLMTGESSFATLAALYSEDPGSASRGGLYEHVKRGQFVPEWEAWAFKLKPNEISDVFETTYGYFIIQLIKRRGNEVDARSLLISPKVNTTALLKSKEQLDSLYAVLQSDTVSFASAAERHSDQAETKYNGGLIVNPFTGTTRFNITQLGQVDQNIAFAIEKLKVREFTKPMPMMTSDGKKAYRILYLQTKSAPHVANLVDDYQKIQAEALRIKKKEVMDAWILKWGNNTYTRIADDYTTCLFTNNWVLKN